MPDVWNGVQQFTRARVALGRTGVSLPTQEVLKFSLAHAQARDAVHLPLDTDHVQVELIARGFQVIRAHSAAPDRATYLRRPDWGRKLSDASRALLATQRSARAPEFVFVIADGLSSRAAANAFPLLDAMESLLPNLHHAPVVIATQARVALGDEIGHLLGAKQIVMMIGERPGLSSPDSLGLYMTHGPKPGLSDADRNCISNVRPEGLGYSAAAHKLAYLMAGARQLGHSGVDLKDDSSATLDVAPAPAALTV
ncbi:MAG TPA: ethanolamine ammonia-lyase subunit EutC [Rhodocyclaceae bacterium]|jgi:ethanolamine ammonia-lyase small subunit|nr:ethanolamine ammonia-lyase subunit EutC [Rhodocyclaceae bacterium]